MLDSLISNFSIFSAIVTFIITSAVLFIKTPLERVLMSDYKIVSLHIIRILIYIFFLSLFFIMLADTFTPFNFSNIQDDEIKILIIFFVFLSSFIVILVYINISIDNIFIPQKKYYIEDGRTKYYIIKSINSDEIILSSDFNGYSSQIIKSRSFLLDKEIKTFINKKYFNKEIRNRISNILRDNRETFSEDEETFSLRLKISKRRLKLLEKSSLLGFIDDLLIEQIALNLNIPIENIV